MIHVNLDRKECDIRVDHLHKWALREVEEWMLRLAPIQLEEKKKCHGTIRDIIRASTYLLFFITKGRYPVGIWRWACFCFCKNK